MRHCGQGGAFERDGFNPGGGEDIQHGKELAGEPEAAAGVFMADVAQFLNHSARQEGRVGLELGCSEGQEAVGFRQPLE